MKKSLRRKLIMSAVAVGAAAVATTSSTYAWFVSNQTVTMGEVSGSVAESNYNLAVKKAGDTAYGTTVEIDDFTTALQPITKKNTGEFVGVDGNAIAQGDLAGYIATFTLNFKATGLDQTKSYTLNITQATAKDSEATAEDSAKTKHTALAEVAKTGDYTAIAKGDELWEDVTKSLILSYQVQGETTVTNQPLNTAAATYDGKAYYNAVSTTDAVDQSPVFGTGFSISTAEDDTKGKGVGATADGYAIKTITSSTSAEITVNFQIWLDGNDDACFDAVASHGWTLALAFKLIEA